MALIDLLSRVDGLKSEIDKLRPIKPMEERRIMDKFRLDWNYHSNAIEGNQLTLGETRVLLLEGLTAHGKPLKDSLDIKGHNEVITYLESFVRKEEVLTEASIRELHKILLHEPYQVEARTSDGQVTKKWVKLGEYKTEPNFAQSPTGMHRPFLLPQDVPVKMSELINWLNEENSKKTLHPILRAAIFHHQFAQIHPFDDGNGRMARILMNLIVMQNGFQPVIIKTKFKQQYIAALVKADAGETDDFFELIASEEIYSEELFLKGARGEDVSDFEDIDKKIALLKQDLSNVPEPVELNPSIQLDFIKFFLKPCFIRLINKLSQFDELYRSTIFHVTANIWANSEHSAQTAWLQNTQSEKNDIVDKIERMIDYQKITFSQVSFAFTWNGFKKAGLKIFDDNCQIQFVFEKHQYRIAAFHGNGGQQIFGCDDVYPNVPTEEQSTKLINSLAEACFNNIETRVRQKQ